MNHRFIGNRRGMTLLDVVVAMGICLALTTMVFGGLAEAREAANRAKCANNLRQIGLAALMYANGEVRTGSYPRTYFSTMNPKVIVDTTGYGKRNSFDTKDTSENNVTASFYLLLKTQDLTPSLFVCPSTTAVPAFGKGSKIGAQDSSNWESIPGNMTYSYNCPFPTFQAISNGWKFNNTLGADMPLAADLNPGGDALLKLTFKSSKEEMKAGNSHNHHGEGQNVVYCDGHVEFQATPFCGTKPNDNPGPGDPTSRDNIYTFGGPNDANGGAGVIGRPGPSYSDQVLLPVGDATLPATKTPAGATGK
jgi:prepilin-type processing-associated H-X9-DG protein